MDRSDAGAAAPARLRDAVRDAVDRGLGFLEAAIRADGAWTSRKYPNLDLTGRFVDEQPPFVAGLGSLTLAACGGPRVRSLRERTGRFIARSISYPGTWRYGRGLPPDLDSLSVCSLAVRRHPWVLFGANLGLVAAARDERGRFRTWIARPDESNVPDSVVTANILSYLAVAGRNGIGEQAAAWIAGLIRDGATEGSSYAYPDAIDLYDATARARERGVPGLQEIGTVLVDRLRARRGADGGYGDTLRTARALSALHVLGAAPAGGDLWATCERILSRQRPDGSWPQHRYWQGRVPPVPPDIGFGCTMLDTASCIEALMRSVPLPEPGAGRTTR